MTIATANGGRRWTPTDGLSQAAKVTIYNCRIKGAVHCCCEHAGQFLPFAPGSPGGASWPAAWQVRERKEEAQMEEVTDEPLYRDRVCGTGIGKAGMVATIRVPSDKDPSRRAQETCSRAGG